MLPAAPVSADEGGNVIYSSIPKKLPGNVISMGFEATSASELGDRVAFEGRKRTLHRVTVVLSSWGCESGHWNTPNLSGNPPPDCQTSKHATFSHPITLNLYEVAGGGAVGDLIASRTQVFEIPFRPSASANCAGGRWYDKSDKTRYNGLAVKIRFTLGADGVDVPDEIIWSVAFDTTHYGDAPIGVSACSVTAAGCGYDSLNVGAHTIPTGSPARRGTDVDPDGAYLDSTWGGAYCDGGDGGTGTFRNDTSPGCWTDHRPMAAFKARGGDEHDDDE